MRAIGGLVGRQHIHDLRFQVIDNAATLLARAAGGGQRLLDGIEVGIQPLANIRCQVKGHGNLQ